MPEKSDRFEEVGTESVWRAPRVSRERKPPPGPARTLTPEQLTEANRILKADGNTAMNRYIHGCHHDLVIATPEILTARTIHPSMLEKLTMSDVLARARTALELTNKRLATYEKRFAELKAQQDTDVLHQTRLEEYIKIHDRMTTEIFDLLSKQPAPLTEHIKKPKAAKSNKGRASTVGFGIAEVRSKVLPVLRKAGVTTFRPQDVIDSLPKAGLSANGVTVNQISAWLYSAANNPSNGIAKAGGGAFELCAIVN